MQENAFQDLAYSNTTYVLPELPHHYGKHVHIVSDPIAWSQLLRLGAPETTQPEVARLVRALYETLAKYVINYEFPRQPTRTKTRMAVHTPHGVAYADALDPTTQAVCVDIARAGILPSQTVYDLLNTLLEPAGVRQDHIYMSRVTGSAGEVVGVSVAGSKIGGDVRDRIVLVPDPMGATGGSMCHVAGIYGDQATMGPSPRKIIAMHLIITPEYVRRVQQEHPELIIYAFRLDRGLSSAGIGKTPLGADGAHERGLNEHHYIVPGAGGLGEVLNNSYV